MLFSDLNQSLRAYLIELGADTAAVVRQFTDGSAIAVYEQPQNLDNDRRVMESYERAIEACRTWLRAVLAVEFMEGAESVTSTECAITLPDRLLGVSLRDGEPPFGGEDDIHYREMLTTPIGRLDYFTYQCIIGIKENPVQLLYRYFQDLIHQIHAIVSLPPHNEADGLLHSSLVADLGIIDLIGVSRYDSFFYDVDRFLDDRFKSSSETSQPATIPEEDVPFEDIFTDDSQSADWESVDEDYFTAEEG